MIETTSKLQQFFLVVIRGRCVVYLLALAMLCSAVIAIRRLPVDALPNLSENQVLVYTRWPDHMPQEIYDQVTRPLSQSLKKVPGVTVVRGSSDVGFSLIYTIFHEHVPLEVARQRIADRLSTEAARLPPNLKPQVAPAGVATGQIFWYTLRGFESDLLTLRLWQDRVIAPRLRRVAGVAEVASVGGFEPEIHVEFSPAALANYDLSLEQAWEQVRNFELPTLDLTAAKNLSSTVLQQSIEQFGKRTLRLKDEKPIALNELASISLQPAPRYGAFEKDSFECVAGVVHMVPSGNTLDVTQMLLKELRSIQRELPSGWICAPCYDRTPLIRNAISTVTRTLWEALIVTSVCIVIVMRHWRASLVIALTLPLAVLGALLCLSCLPALGNQVNANIMSLAGIAVSVGILVDAAVVIVENVNYRLQQQFGTRSVTGNTDLLVAAAAAQVARPALMAILIMLVSFAPLFALGGLDGQMMRPLLWTKSLTLLSVIVLALTLVPCLARDLLRGRVRKESDSRLLSSIRQVYEPVLAFCFHSPGPLLCMLSILAVWAIAVIGIPLTVQCMVLLAVALNWLVFKSFICKVITAGLVILVGLTAQATVRPLSLALRIPLDEGMVMDMPITIPRTTIQQATDDLKARNMVLCRFPEIAMVSGKVGRAETAFDPAPIDMIETMVEFRQPANWPRRRLTMESARAQSLYLFKEMISARLVESSVDPNSVIDEVVACAMPRFDAISREVCWQLTCDFESRHAGELIEQLGTMFLNRLNGRRTATHASTNRPQVSWLRSHVPLNTQLILTRELNANTVAIVLDEFWRVSQRSDSPIDRLAIVERVSEPEIQYLTTKLQAVHRRAWATHLRHENQVLMRRSAATWNQIIADELFRRVAIVDEQLKVKIAQMMKARYQAGRAQHHAEGHLAMPGTSDLPMIEPHRVFDDLMAAADKRFQNSLWLWPHTPASLTSATGEMDQSVQMPGWANVWTRPIQNRVDMLTTGVNAEVGVRVVGGDLNEVVAVSEQIAQIVKDIPGASGVIADPVRGKDYTEFVFNEANIKSFGLSKSASKIAVLAATTGLNDQVAWSIANAPALNASLRGTLQQPSAARASQSISEHSSNDPIADTLVPVPVIMSIPVPAPLPRSNVSNGDAPNIANLSYSSSKVQLVPLGSLGTLRHYDGPSTIKSTNGQLSNYVRLNVVGRSAVAWVSEARVVVEGQDWPQGVSVEWTGQFEHALQTKATMRWMIPGCLLVIVLVIWITFRDIADTLLILLTLPGAMIGAVLAQWVLGVPVSLSVVVGYISCLGMAAATGMVMIVYLRDAVAQAGGLSDIGSLDQLKAAVLRGAVHRLRPKLLTEIAMIFSLVPLVWSTGAGADVIRPMAAPVLGGILIADELIDLLLPALFFHLRSRRWYQLRKQKQGEPS